MNIKNYPLRGHARILSKKFSISDKIVSTWLNSEAIPETSKIPILVRFLNVTTEWLLSRNCEKFLPYTTDKSNILDLNILYKNFLNDFSYINQNHKLTPAIIRTFNHTLILMTKH